MASYTYSIATDTLNAAVDLGKLSQEILDSSITTPLNYSRVNGDQPDDLVIYFTGTLTGPEQTTLTGVVNAHDGIEIPGNLELPERPDDAPAVTNKIVIFSKEVSGVAHLCVTTDDGTVHALTPGDKNIDGGNANTTYTILNLDGGGA